MTVTVLRVETNTGGKQIAKDKKYQTTDWAKR